MPNKSKQVQDAKEASIQPVEQSQQAPISATRDDYLRARAVIQLYREQQKSRPKRPCSEKQLEALARGRTMNKRSSKKNQEETK